MIYEVTGYIGTGFNALNIPDGPVLIQGMTSSARTFQPVDLVQPFGLNSVRLRASLEEVEDLDFIQIENEWYACGIPHMTSEDVAEIPLEHQGILSIGGVKNITILDGMIARRHVAPLDQKNFAALDDPFLAPAKPQPTQSSDILFDDQGADVYTVLVSTADITKLGAAAIAGELESDTYGSGDATIAVPHIPDNAADGKSMITYPVKQGSSTLVTVSRPSPGLAYFRGTEDVNRAGMIALRQCGVSEGILAQYILPATFAGSNTSLRSGPTTDNFGTVEGKYQKTQVQFGVDDLAAANPILALNKYNQFRLISIGSGAGITMPGYMLAKDSSLNRVLEIVCLADARQGGRPYFRFGYIMDQPYTAMCLVGGAEWLNAPLVFNGSKEGSGLAAQKLDFAISKINKNAPYENAQAVLSMGANLFGASNATYPDAADYGSAYARGEGMSMAALMGQGFSGDYAGQDYAASVQSGAIGSMSMRAGGAVLNMAQRGLQLAQNNMQRNLRKQELIQNVALDYFVAAPEVRFSNYNGLRDYMSNGCVVIKSTYSHEDLVRLNRVINMYGIYVGREAMTDTSAMTSRTDYNYVETAGVSVGGAYPRWRREEIEAELNGGLRIWHVKPNSALYDAVPN